MDDIVDAMNNAYQEFVVAIASTLEAKEASGGQVTAATDAALENLKQSRELFRVACDQAEEFVDHRVSGWKPGQPVTPGLPPISAVRLEQMSKAVRWLVLELQQGSGSAGNLSMPQHSSAPFDARFHEDSTQ
ncbi:putative mediator of RNA polymerase II transcription subunit 32 [Helianthus annuus]|nr:putative mediator of RNA polymerase II transcription subunit 32 [Helianthus annuus]